MDCFPLGDYLSTHSLYGFFDLLPLIEGVFFDMTRDNPALELFA